jgi:hypothetical protein
VEVAREVRPADRGEEEVVSLRGIAAREVDEVALRGALPGRDLPRVDDRHVEERARIEPALVVDQVALGAVVQVPPHPAAEAGDVDAEAAPGEEPQDARAVPAVVDEEVRVPAV